MGIENSLIRVTSASRDLQSDAEQFSRVTEISICTEHYQYRFFFLHTVLSTDFLSLYNLN